ncbi:hypothetical protein MHBO_001387 [Bonamia ostreae]|uniref:Uncharacterized protein n=1 Tax=Bonamia ostreae TaxID=126728 RepID=A0ABV2AIR9_9EUKA
MPIFLIGEKPRNLITNGNFEVPDSFQSWQIESGGSIQKCERRYDFLDVLKFSSAKCWRGENNVKQAKADLEIFVPKNKEITLFQQKKIYYPFNGDFRLTLKSSTKKLRQFVKTTLSILQKDKNNKNLLEKTSLVFQVTSKDQFISTKFDVLEATRLLEFRITMKSVDDVSSIMKVSNIETILSINKVHIWILFLCAVWFTVITFVCVLLLGKKEKEISDVEIRNKGIFMFGFALLRKTVLNFIENQDFFDNIIANILWGSGFSAFNTLVLIYLEDKYAFSSSKLALTFLLISTSIVAGAYLCYILESKYGRWNTALVFFSVW